MRVSRKQVEENKKTILEAAGQLFRERGFESVTVTDVMKAAGLTHGGFYGYFKSKEDLIAQTLAGLQGETEPLTVDLASVARRYLSPEHRDDFGHGCPLAALASEVSRQPGSARSEMTDVLKRQFARFGKVAPGTDEHEKRRAAIGSSAAMIGALILARMTDDPDLSTEILDETRVWLSDRDHGKLRSQGPSDGKSDAGS
ncbi:TetR/AcrR family transcriptional regulator [Ensifer sp. ENS07]|uniref:TetR/AcrR family transcriptional regulator n=1 Tax=Ensifer adhaerens TaxID=106592 RepID=A0A9Q9D896_ENSAD|nr:MULTISPECIES: TetR/AcrR family transcriptional regulator [Ensifer]OWZ89818.1 TetR family transcriptional regulator [Sinorhizobium sp. LM21]MBD9593565.1 TetR/AcrR family transcriptional regulator [Ensifer sp. ENS05]MBD9641213.1 TetR/AcrR family transcriptional regulator [Ensifer sp. ENS07]USJ22388.1 TetR/AcrR family transcriptional regulator [Ensifer adhaerens]UTV35703.1 TetR/AcrR family transcriptional regulator [Ensifer adhaerens]